MHTLLSLPTMPRTHDSQPIICATVRSLLSSTVGIGQPAHIFRDLPRFAGAVAGVPIGEKARARLRLRRISMSDQHRVISAGQHHPGPHTQSRTAERTLDSAIVHAEISRSHEEYLDIFDEFYADDIEGSSETTQEPIRGK